MYIFLLTCLLRGMTVFRLCLAQDILISTHMPLARHDVNKMGKKLGEFISTHMPLARHDIRQPQDFEYPPVFLLTCLLRGMTNQRFSIQRNPQNFYSHASCEA